MGSMSMGRLEQGVVGRHLNPVGLTREGSANARWLDGGLIYAPPAR